MKKIFFVVTAFIILGSCKKSAPDRITNDEPGPVSESATRADISYAPLSLTIFNPCCQEEIYLTGMVQQVRNSNTVHMDARDISGVGITSGLHYTVQSTSVRNYVFDPNEYLATLNWSIRMKSETGCGYNVQFVVHITRNENGEIKASIHNGHFLCL